MVSKGRFVLLGSLGAIGVTSFLLAAAQGEGAPPTKAPVASPWAVESPITHTLNVYQPRSKSMPAGESLAPSGKALRDMGDPQTPPDVNPISSNITINVYASSAPNAFGSPSWSGYLVNALYALENNLATNGDRATDPTGYERAPAQVGPGEIAVTSFNSWRGRVSPAAPFNSELGNRMHFGLHAVGDGSTLFRLEDLTFALHSDDPWDSLIYVGNFVGFSYNGTTRYGIHWGANRVKGGGDDTVYTAGNGTTLVDEIVYVGVGNGWWPSGGTPQTDMDDYFAWVASYGPINVQCTYDILGYTGSDSVLVSQQIVNDFGVQGWRSDDTRNPAGTDLVGTNYTHYGKPGQAPTAADDTAIAGQIKFVDGPGGVPALEMTKTSTGGNSKCTLSKVDTAGFASGDWRSGFFADYRYYAGSSTEMAVLKIGIQSPLWGTGAGQSQNGFTAVRSGESVWDLILVDWRGTQPPWTVGAWDRFTTNADTQCWRVYRQGTNGFFNVTPTPPGAQVGWSLNELYAMSNLLTPAHVARTGYTWSEMLFGAGAKVVSLQFGVGSSTGSTTSYIDYLDTSLVNGGERVDFVGPLPSMTTLGVYPSLVPDEEDPQVALADSPLGFEPDSWRNCLSGVGTPPYKVNWHARYLADGDYLSALFPAQAPTLKISDLESLLYWTKRPSGTLASRDWLLFIYTRPPGDASWYGKRFVNNYDAHTEIGVWTHYSTDSGMTFRKNSGTPTAHMDLATLKATYGTELIEMISVQTDSGWGGASGFNGYMDGLTIILTDGSVGHVNFVRQPTLTLQSDDECYAASETVTVGVWMNDVPESVVGGQFFLSYDDSKLTFVSADPGGAPFTDEVFESVPGDGGIGTIDYAVCTASCVPSATGTEQLAVLTFTADVAICSATDLISWRSHTPPTRLSDESGGAVEPTLVDLDMLDDINPTVTTPASNLTVECDGTGNVAELTAWLTSHGGSAATDNCGTVTWTNDFTALSDLCGATGAATVTFTATDSCGNFSTTSATFTIQDTANPTVTTPASNMTVECDGAGNVAQLSAWLTSHGGSVASDACGGVTWTDNFTALSDLCGATGAATVMFTATDSCGNFSTTSATFTIQDTVSPTFTCPSDITVPADAGVCTAVVSYTTPTASEACGSLPTVTCLPASGSTFGTGTTTVTCTATDDCGNMASCSTFDVTVQAINKLDIAVQLQPAVAAGPFTRCITLGLWDCPGSSPVLTTDAMLTFTGGLASGTIDVACGNYECITARDKRHTLRRTDEAFHINLGTKKYVADFTAAPPGGDWLIGGNLNNDSFIDILDFGVFSSLWLINYGTGSTTCSTPAPHADVNGDGIVNLAEFSFIQFNFLKGNEANCCGAAGFAPPGDGTEAVEQISVAELWELGLGELASGDLNDDGWLDVDDIEAFALGARPTIQLVPANSTANEIEDE